MDRKQIIKCPVCESKGIKQNLAAVQEDGGIKIQRFFSSDTGGNFTLVYGSEFQLRCGLCGEVAYMRVPGTNIGTTVRWAVTSFAGTFLA